MSIETRLGRGEPEAVSPTDVMRYWLGEELDDDPDSDLDPDELATEPTLREELLERKPIAGRVFASETAEWYDVELSAEELKNLRVVVGEHDEDWRAITDDDRIESVARRIMEVDDLSEFDEATPKNLDKVVGLAEEFADSRPESRLVVVKEGDDPAYVADGNHRAVAHVLYLLNGGEYEGHRAYLGIRE